MSLVNGPNSYSELAQTIGDLGLWLSTVETGLGTLLETQAHKPEKELETDKALSEST